eukprot:CAMPEP_0197601146 /NCGR_PEP_ID=MMETSP1326-20131121/34749_1 /TAXON_ID=1155430 /ORGANISM="Genus nov. species nov., Strain RCC2288" /LENGTH=70 /DNA_ID=CAMNT_0043168333 /DNA_START=27 /DNA_END=236 /DNA_ORIENTATION=-
MAELYTVIRLVYLSACLPVPPRLPPKSATEREQAHVERRQGRALGLDAPQLLVAEPQHGAEHGHQAVLRQ